MKLKILYFASLKEQVNISEEVLEIKVENLSDLKTYLAGRGKIWQELLLDNVKILTSVNQCMVNNDHTLKDGDEIAFFPPVTGG